MFCFNTPTVTKLWETNYKCNQSWIISVICMTHPTLKSPWNLTSHPGFGVHSFSIQHWNGQKRRRKKSLSKSRSTVRRPTNPFPIRRMPAAALAEHAVQCNRSCGRSMPVVPLAKLFSVSVFAASRLLSLLQSWMEILSGKPRVVLSVLGQDCSNCQFSTSLFHFSLTFFNEYD